MSTFEGLKFRYRDTMIHRLHPLVKLLLAVGVSAYALLFSSIPILLAILTSQIALVFISRVHREWLHTLLGAIGVALLVFLISLGVNLSGGYFEHGILDLMMSTQGAIVATVKWFVFFAAFSSFFLTTSPEDLSVALEGWHLPYAFCFSIATAVRFIPVLANDLEHIMDAQRSRGVDFDTLNPVRRILNVRPLLLPLVANAIRRSLDLEEALDSRAFGASKKRTHLYELSLGTLDYVLLTVSVVLLVTSAYYGIVLQMII